MEESKRYYRLGTFVLVSIVAMAAALFLFGGRTLFSGIHRWPELYLPLPTRIVRTHHHAELVSHGSIRPPATCLTSRNGELASMSAIMACPVRVPASGA